MISSSIKAGHCHLSTNHCPFLQERLLADPVAARACGVQTNAVMT